MRHARLLTAVAAAFALATAPQAHADQLPVRYGNSEMVRIAQTDWDGPVPGANDFGCKPTPEHPKPIILVGSTFLSDAVNWTAIAPYLHNQGYCVFTLDYGRTMYNVAPGLNGMDPIPMSATEVDRFVDQVLDATGTSQVDFVAHSQGGVVTRYYLNELGGVHKADQVVLLSSPYTLTGPPLDLTAIGRSTIPKPLYDAILYNGAVPPLGLGLLDPWSVGKAQVLQPTLRYIQITDAADELGLFGGMRVPDGARNASTHYINDVCPTDLSQHFAQPYSPTAVAMIGNALDARHPVTPPCTIVPLYSF
ncbi:esterase/lipase family protein [Nocardia iowensis]|uniref:Alpha/beta fold hydrolase n=1 Tax=Nocardia iowensis TaxID=204891 RepID=A0ABX8RIY1_NOCIO|nr:alpha/beta fold hydrolase [Nocardia iowensis]QXN88864.1 alpha/beta fold hydrolase [Nocardia iowensis]